MTPSDERILQALVETKAIAMVGASVRETRDSYRVGQYLMHAGYRVIPVNPTYAGAALFDTTVIASLSEIKEPVGLLNIFRRSEFVAETVASALDTLPSLQTVWMQLGVTNKTARAMAEERGLFVVEDRCIKIEHARLIA